MSVASDQHGRGSGNLAEERELPWALVLAVDEPDSLRPRGDVEAPSFTEVQQHGPGVVQQAVHTRRTCGGVQVEVGHSPTDQRVSFAKVVVDVETGDHRCEAPP